MPSRSLLGGLPPVRIAVGYGRGLRLEGVPPSLGIGLFHGSFAKRFGGHASQACRQSPGWLWDIGQPAAATERTSPDASLTGSGKPKAIRGLEARKLEPKASREKRHRLQTHGRRPAIIGAMKHYALSKSLFSLPLVEADLLRIVAQDWAHLLDSGSLERLCAKLPSAGLTQRTGNLSGQVPYRGGRVLAATWCLARILDNEHLWDSIRCTHTVCATGTRRSASALSGACLRFGSPRIRTVQTRGLKHAHRTARGDAVGGRHRQCGACPAGRVP